MNEARGKAEGMESCSGRDFRYRFSIAHGKG